MSPPPLPRVAARPFPMVPALTRPYPRAMQQPPGWGPQGYPPPQGYAPRPEHTFFQDNIVTPS